MDDKRFDKPVRVAIGGPGKIRNVTSTREAAECLLHRWPTKGGPKHRLAREACIDVLAGDKDSDLARAAFIEAAKEAGIWIERETMG